MNNMSEEKMNPNFDLESCLRNKVNEAKRYLEDKHKRQKDGACEESSYAESFIYYFQNVETILAELKKKDKIIDVMTEWIGDRCFYSDDYGNSCEIIQDSCYDPVKDCKNCIKQYFEKEVKDD